MRAQPEFMPTLLEKKNGQHCPESFNQGSLSSPWKAQNDTTLITSSKRKCSVSSKGGPSKKKKKKTTSKAGRKPDPKFSLTTKGFKRHFAEHNYHDYAQVKPSEMLEAEKLTKGSRGGVHNPFPAVLHRMMEDAVDKDFWNIVSWQSHGRAFLIRDPKAFVADVLPKYFKHSKLSSFQRQLSLYGFVRLTQDGQDRGAYYHECFLRGRPFLCSKIQRTRVKGTWVRTSSSPESEPHFYNMEQVRDFGDLNSHQEDELSESRSIEDSHSSSDQSDVEGFHHHISQEEDNSGSVQKHINEVLALCSNDEEEQEQSTQCFGTSFLHGYSERDSMPTRQLLAETCLRPPPAFPSAIVSSNTLSTLLLDTDDRCSSSSKVFKNAPKLQFTNMSTWSLTASLGANIPSFAPIAVNDDELAMFLTDIDLETDFDTDDVMQIMSI